MYLVNLWYIHSVTSNLNWIITVFFYVLGNAYYLFCLLYKPDPTEASSQKILQISLIILLHFVYIWHTYILDKHRKEKFCDN